MNIKAVSNVSIISVALLIASAVFAFTAGLAHADAAPTVTTTVLNASNATTTSAQIGSLVHAYANVASSTASTTPSGTVNFNLYPNTSCSGTAVVQSGVPLVNGTATSSAAIVPASGLSYLVHYSGDINFPVSDGLCQPLVATASSATLSTTLSTTNIVAGASAHDSAILTNATTDATGTVAYNVYTNNSCTTGTQSAGLKTVTNRVVPDSDALPFNVAGTYFWQAMYSGDAHNAAATSTCGSEILTVAATSTNATTTAGISGTVYNDLNKNDVKDGSEPGLSGWTVWLHKGTNGNSAVLSTATTDGSGNYSFGNLAVGSYFVEEQEQNGWNQTSGDTHVVLANASSSQIVNFANVSKGGGTTPPPVSTTTPGTISGTIFNDLNKNDVKDSSDPGLAGWTIWLRMGVSHDPYNDPVVATTTSDGSGNYSFVNRAFGNYFVEEQEQSGWTQTTSDSVVALNSAHVSADVDFANIVKTAGHGGKDNVGSVDNTDNNATSTDQGHGHSDNGFSSGNSTHGQGNNSSNDTNTDNTEQPTDVSTDTGGDNSHAPAHSHNHQNSPSQNDAGSSQSGNGGGNHDGGGHGRGGNH